MTIIPDPIFVILQAIPFVLTMFALKAIIFDPMIAYLDEREAATTGGREDIAELQDKVESRLAEYEAKLEQARSEAADIRAQRRAEASKAHLQRVAEARSEADERIAKAVAEIGKAKAEAATQLEQSARSLAGDIATQVLGREAAS